jgi:hypothetical protein
MALLMRQTHGCAHPLQRLLGALAGTLGARMGNFL